MYAVGRSTENKTKVGTEPEGRLVNHLLATAEGHPREDYLPKAHTSTKRRMVPGRNTSH